MATAKSPTVCRRLVLFLDGTWNLDDEKGPATNIVRMRELLSKGLMQQFTQFLDQGTNSSKLVYDTVDAAFETKGASGVIHNGFEYLVYYDQGVGSGPLIDRSWGALTGKGLDQNVRQAYKFLSCNYRPGDEIFVFGFSRGAFTARTLCGYLHAFGLLKKEHCTEANERISWNYYRTPWQDRLSGQWHEFQPSIADPTDGRVYDRRLLRVRCLGVFDTVGALGIPFILRRVKKRRYQFHDTSVNSLVDIRLHAMAIDEWRWSFEATVWRKPKFQILDPKNSPTEQVWFVGAHGDVGGGYVNWENKGRGLSDIPLSWMIQRVNHHLSTSDPIGVGGRDRAVDEARYVIPPNRKAGLPFAPIKIDRDQHAAEQHRPWWFLRGRLPLACRLINQHMPGKRRWRSWIKIKGEMVHEEPIGEMVHVSALERLGKRVLVEEMLLRRHYRPKNLVVAIPEIIATYRKDGVAVPNAWKKYVNGRPTTATLIVDWDGRPLEGPQGVGKAGAIICRLPPPKKLGYVPAKAPRPY